MSGAADVLLELQMTILSFYGNGFEFSFFHNPGKVQTTLIAIYKPFSDSMACRLLNPLFSKSAPSSPILRKQFPDLLHMKLRNILNIYRSTGLMPVVG